MVEIAIDIALRSAGVAAWTPAALAPSLWLAADQGTYQDAARTVPATADGDPVGGWADRSAGGYHASQATAGFRPTLQTNELNGKPVLRLDGTDDWLGHASAALETGSGVTVAAVVKIAAPTNFGMAWSHGSDAGTDHELRQNSTTGKAEWNVNGSGSIVSATDRTGSWDLWLGTWNGVAGGPAILRVGGVVEATGTGASIAPHVGYAVGTRPLNTFPLLWNGDVAEVVVIPRLCSAAEIEQLEAYLMSKYAL